MLEGSGTTRYRGHLAGLRDQGGADQTLQNLLRSMTLALELRSRYRVFEFEAVQDGHMDVAELFNRLRATESKQIAELSQQLHEHLGHLNAYHGQSTDDQQHNSAL
jgi:hypothetical protein